MPKYDFMYVIDNEFFRCLKCTGILRVNILQGSSQLMTKFLGNTFMLSKIGKDLLLIAPFNRHFL